MSKVMRSVKNVTKGYSHSQIKVREATSNDPWGPTGTQMSEIAHMTYNTSTEFYEIMDMLDKRLNDKGKNWRHVLKALKVLDYCLHEGSEMVVTWARQSIYIIKTLREFQYIDDDGRDVGQNVRVAAKELTSLILDEDRLRAERSDRKSWKSRVTGLDEHPPPGEMAQRRTRPRRRSSDDDDTEMRLAIEASKHQEEEDRRKRESRSGGGGGGEDDDLAKAIKLSKEEEELRRQRELESANAASLFDDEPAQSSSQQQTQFTGYNQGYTQGNQVDFFANPVDQGHMQPQQTGFVPGYAGFAQHPTGFQPQPTGFQPQQTGFVGGFGMGMDPYGQQGMSPFQQQQQQQQPTGFNPYAQQQVQSPEPAMQPGSNNPWASSGIQAQATAKPAESNNPFASSLSRPSAFQTASMSALSSLPEQKTLSTFSPPAQPTQAPSFQAPQKELSAHEAKLNALLSSGDGMDTFGNTGQLRIPAQHTAPGTFVNSAGAGLNKVAADATGNNPFLRSQMTGMPSMSYGSPQQQQVPAATGFGVNGGQSNNPFGGARPQQQSNQGQDLIQF